MINKLEIHLKTLDNLSQLKENFKTLGVPLEIELCVNGVILHIMKNNKAMNVFTKLYDKDGKEFEYEFAVDSESDFMTLLELLKKMK